MIILFIIGIAAFLTGVITATISLIRALTQEVKYLKQIRLHSCDSSQSIFLALAENIEVSLKKAVKIAELPRAEKLID